MIENNFEEVHDESWKRIHIPDQQHEFYIIRQVIPWQKVVDHLQVYYAEDTGRLGKNIRVMSALLILQKLRKLGDQAVIDLVKENRYAQYFCNVCDKELMVFLDRSTLVRFRQRLGAQGCARLESLTFENLRRSGVIVNGASLIDSSVLANNLVYPNDVDLLYKGFCKMEAWARAFQVPLWWNHDLIKKRWKVYSFGKKQERLRFLLEFQSYFVPATKTFQKKVRGLEAGQEKKEVNIG